MFTYLLTAPTKQVVVDMFHEVTATGRLIAVRMTPGGISWVSYRTPRGEVAKLVYYGDAEETHDVS